MKYARIGFRGFAFGLLAMLISCSSGTDVGRVSHFDCVNSEDCTKFGAGYACRRGECRATNGAIRYVRDAGFERSDGRAPLPTDARVHDEPFPRDSGDSGNNSRDSALSSPESATGSPDGGNVSADASVSSNADATATDANATEDGAPEGTPSGAPGAVDTIQKLGFGRGRDGAYASTIDFSGGILIGATYFTGSRTFPLLVRYTSDGSVDQSFGNDGFVLESEFVDVGNSPALQMEPVQVAVQSDGKYVALLRSMHVIRYEAAGKRDTTFGQNGVVHVDFGMPFADAQSLLVQPDGRLVVAGFTFDGTGPYHASVARLDPDGSYDGSFGSNGRAIVYDGAITSAALDSAAQVLYFAGDITGSTQGALAVRCRVSDGSLDTTFGTGGKVILSSLGGQTLLDVDAIVGRSDGAVLLVRGNAGQTSLVGLTGSGALDPGFGDAGVAVVSNVSDESLALLLMQPDGDLIVGGSSRVNFPNVDFIARRFTSNGAADVGDGSAGSTTMSFGPSINMASAMSVQSDGKVVLAGEARVGSDFDIAVARLNELGSPDPGFGTGGEVTTNFGNGDDVFTAAARQGDGRIVAVGKTYGGSEWETLAARFTPSGELDETFGTRGIVIQRAQGNGFVASFETRGVAVQPDGRIVVSGQFDDSLAVARLLANGSPELLPIQDFVRLGPGYAGTRVALQTDGKIVVAGRSSEGFLSVSRFTTDLVADNFGTFGLVSTDFGDTQQGVDVIVQGSNKLLLFGQRGGLSNAAPNGPSDWIAARYDLGGSLDPTFGDGSGRLAVDLGVHDVPSVVGIDTNGNLLFAGSTDVSGSFEFAVMRHSSDGITDANFGANGLATAHPGSDAHLYGLLPEDDGTILGVGCAAQSPTMVALARWRSDGELDPSLQGTGTTLTAVGTGGSCGRALAGLGGGKVLALGSTNDGLDEDALLIRYWR